MKLCTRCDRDIDVGVHLVIRRNGREIDHCCRLPGQGAVLVQRDGNPFGAWVVSRDKIEIWVGSE